MPLAENPNHPLPPKDNNPHWPMPAAYGDMDIVEQKRARMDLLTSWYDPFLPGEFLSFPTNFKVAFKFFRETYIKGWAENRRYYYMPDCRWVETWIDLITHRSVAIAAFRGSGKTFTLVRVYSKFAALTKPGTIIQVTEINEDRTKEEIAAIQHELMNNELLLSEFGESRPRKHGAKKWNALESYLNNGSMIIGVPSGAAIRGRHPDVFILDDAEKDDEIHNPKYREFFLNTWLFKSVLGTLKNKGHFLMVGTLLDEVACLSTAVFKRDKRFVNWKTASCPLIMNEGDEEKRYSMWPEYMSPKDFDKMMSGEGTADGAIRGLGRAATLTEYQNKPTSDAQRGLPRNDVDHGYCILEDEAGDQHVYIPKSRSLLPYSEWEENLQYVSGLDPASSESTAGDYGAMVTCGKDPADCLWVADAWHRKGRYVNMIVDAFKVQEKWSVRRLGYEMVGTAGSEFRLQLHDYWRDRQKESRYCCGLLPLKHAGANADSKTKRIRDMQYRFLKNQIKIPVWWPEGVEGKFDIPEGYKVLRPKCSYSISVLCEQIDSFTEFGCTGHDDVLDALQMCHDTAFGIRVAQTHHPSITQKTVNSWEKMGYKPPKELVPMDGWTDEMMYEAISAPPMYLLEDLDPWD